MMKRTLELCRGPNILRGFSSAAWNDCNVRVARNNGMGSPPLDV